MAFVRDGREQGTHLSDLIWRSLGRKQNIYRHDLVGLQRPAHSGGQPWVNLVGRVVFTDPLHEGNGPQSVEANAAEARYESILRNVTQQVHPNPGELLARFPTKRAAELDQEKSRHRWLGER